MKSAIVAILSLLAFVSGVSIAQDAPMRTVKGLEGPANPAGFTPELLGLVPLDDQIEGMAGWNLRTRRVTFEPGGVAPVHPHIDRPTVFYILEGEVVEHRSDVDEPQRHKAGDAVAIKQGAAHWWKNETDAVAVLLATDIVSDEELSMGKAE